MYLSSVVAMNETTIPPFVVIVFINSEKVHSRQSIEAKTACDLQHAWWEERVHPIVTFQILLQLNTEHGNYSRSKCMQLLSLPEQNLNAHNTALALNYTHMIKHPSFKALKNDSLCTVFPSCSPNIRHSIG
jgi:hypothetical protein